MRGDLMLALSYLSLPLELGLGFLISAVLGFYIGRKIDKALASAPLFTVVFLSAGMALGFFNAWRLLEKVDRRLRKK
ncbi:MAG TPA: AtpZ/AtpI family protein [Clostridia bacterium]|nr:AtpZ/AtpI family protein [Clostridia bacterium]